METWPLLRHRRDTHIARPWGFDDIMAEHHEYVETAVGEITRRGPLAPADLPDPSHTGRRLPESWYGSVPRAVLEACFGRGQLAVTARRENFSRVFDLAERVIPARALRPPSSTATRPSANCCSSPRAPAASARRPTSRTTSA